MRVAPPTITTPWMSVSARSASRSALRTGPSVFCTSVCVMLQKVSVSSVRSTNSPVESLALIAASPCTVRYSFASRARTSSRRMSRAESGASFACSTIQQNTRWSKSSPPSIESPLVATTSNTPRESLRMERSKVPPPRS